MSRGDGLASRGWGGQNREDVSDSLKFWSDQIRIMILCGIVMFFWGGINKAQNGIVKMTDIKGNLEAELSYADNVLEGTCYWYYPGGNIKSEKTFTGGVINGWVKEFFEDGLLKEEGRVEMGVRDGITKFYYDNGGIKEVRSYESGRLVKIVKVNYDKDYIAPLEAYEEGRKRRDNRAAEKIFQCDADICPQPAGGIEEIYNKLVYPEHAKLYGLEGSLILFVTVDEKGIAQKIEFFEPLGLGCEEAAIEAVKDTRFIPGERNGEQVEAVVTFRLDFTLDGRRLDNQQVVLVKKNTSQPVKKEVEKIEEDPLKNGNFICDSESCPYPAGGLKSIMDKVYIPGHARRQGIKGEVVIRADVDEFGIVRKTEVVSGPGYGLNESAEIAVLDTEFKPAIINGIETRTWVTIKIPVGEISEEK